MRRRITLAGVTFALLAFALAGPASANAPKGKGLVSFGEFQCEGVGPVSVFGPEGGPTGFTTTGEHVVAQSFSVTFTDLDGNEFSFSKTFGVKAGLTTFTCTQSFEEPDEGSGEFTVVVAIVPPKS
jgi:hypothetical protein